jgi:hypothetical protein
MRSESKLNQHLGYKAWQKGKAEALEVFSSVDAIYADKSKTHAEQKDAIASLLIGKGIFAESDFMSETATKNG